MRVTPLRISLPLGLCALAFATMALVSLLTPQRVPSHTRRFLARLHAPESLVLDRSSS